MRIHTLWESEGVADGEIPWLLMAAEPDETGDLPDDYVEARQRPTVRELIIAIPDGDVVRLFLSPVVRGTVVPPKP
jgi:hypothetical protein